MPDNTENYYVILNIDTKATNKEINDAYDKLANEYSQKPDQRETYIKIAKAWETLIDPKRRAAFDAKLLATNPFTSSSDFNASEPISYFETFRNPDHFGQAINDKFSVGINDRNKVFLSFVGPNNTRDNKLIDDGWKFHLDINLNERGKAWDLIIPILMKYGVEEAKIIHPNYKPKNNGNLMHKAITIYTSHAENAKPIDYVKLLAEIENTLRENRIKPSSSPTTNTDRAIPNSRYITYRNDKHELGFTIDAKSAKSYNESGKADPFLDINMDPQFKSATSRDEERENYDKFNPKTKTTVDTGKAFSKYPSERDERPTIGSHRRPGKS